MAGSVFISYSRADRGYVDKLAPALDAASIPFWYDHYGVPGRVDLAVKNQIDVCSAVIVIMTPESFESEWVANEISYAKSVGKPILPMLLRGQAFLTLSSHVYEDVSGERLPGRRFLDHLFRLTNASTATASPTDTLLPDGRLATKRRVAVVRNVQYLPKARNVRRLGDPSELESHNTADRTKSARRWRGLALVSSLTRRFHGRSVDIVGAEAVVASPAVPSTRRWWRFAIKPVTLLIVTGSMVLVGLAGDGLRGAVELRGEASMPERLEASNKALFSAQLATLAADWLPLAACVQAIGERTSAEAVACPADLDGGSLMFQRWSDRSARDAWLDGACRNAMVSTASPATGGRRSGPYCEYTGHHYFTPTSTPTGPLHIGSLCIGWPGVVDSSGIRQGAITCTKPSSSLNLMLCWWDQSDPVAACLSAAQAVGWQRIREYWQSPS